jgi:hypothetical protein
LAMCCDNPAALAGADAVLVAVEFTLAGAGFLLEAVEAAGLPPMNTSNPAAILLSFLFGSVCQWVVC